jgi:hypothetical protein
MDVTLEGANLRRGAPPQDSKQGGVPGGEWVYFLFFKTFTRQDSTHQIVFSQDI